MIEWEFGDDRPLPPLPPEPEPGRGWERRNVLMLAAILLALLLLAGGFIWRTARERERRLRADLQQTILAEERARAFGQRDQIPELVANDAPGSWRRAYEAQFQAGAASPTLAVHDVELDGQGALVTLVVTPTGSLAPGPHREARFYRLIDSRWRRAPLPPERWGSPQTLNAPPFVFTYRAHDDAFVRSLVPDLRRLVEQVRVHWHRPALSTALAIDVVSQDLAGPFFYQRGTHLTVNSPLLTRTTAALSPNDEVRTALGQALVARLTGPERVALNRYRANGRLVLQALRRAETRQVLLAPEMRAAEEATWRQALAGTWHSPLTGDVAATGESAPAGDQEGTALAANLLVAYVTAAYGPAGPGRLAQALEIGTTWDEVTRIAFGASALNFELAARAYSLGLADASPAPRDQAQIAPHSFPLEGTVVEITHRRAPLVLRVKLPSDPAPVQVWLRDPARLEGSQQAPFPPDCLAPHSVLRIEGDWIVVGQRLHASRIEVIGHPAAIRDDQIAPLPRETVALLIATEVARPHALVALDAAGRLTPLLATAGLSDLRVAPPRPAGESVAILRLAYAMAPPGCSPADGTQIVATLDNGRAQRWPLGAASLEGLAWEPDGRALLVLRRRSSPDRGLELVRYALGEAAPGDPILLPSRAGELIGWSGAVERLVFTTANEPPDGLLLIGMAGGAVTYLPLDPRPSGRPALDLGGQWVAYLAENEGLTFGSGRSVWVLHLATGERRRLYQAAPGCGLTAPSWNTETGRPRLLVAKGCSAGGRLVATDLLLLDPELPGESSLGVSLSSGLSLSQPLWCTAGRILFLQHGPKSTDLVQVRLPGQDPQRLTRADRLVPLACFSGG